MGLTRASESETTQVRRGFERFARGKPTAGMPSMIGGGEPGGKASGLAEVRTALEHGLGGASFGGIGVDIPPMVVLGTDVFDAFLEENALRGTAESDLSDERIAKAFQHAHLPVPILGDLRSFIDGVRVPLAVRSSSLLEDARGTPFAGVYATKMIPNASFDPATRFDALTRAVKFVFASTFARSARDYRAAVGYGTDGEKMAVILQELVGRRYPNRFYPELSGVARSLNAYPTPPAGPDDGVVSLALGLGKTVVDGGRCWAYAPTAPRGEPPFGSVERLLKETQTTFWAVHMGTPAALDPTRETEYLISENLTVAERDGALQHLVSTYSPLSGRLSIGMPFEGPRALTFAPLLLLDEIPLNALILEVLKICEDHLSAPVEIEFAMTFEPHRFRFLQVRALPEASTSTEIAPEESASERTLVSGGMALGNGVLGDITDIVYTPPQDFSLSETAAMVPELEGLNRGLMADGRPYLLIVLGRLGTTDPWLGIPIRWAGISGARAVVEAAQEGVRVELSQGSHFFHNIVSLGIKYFNLTFSDRPYIDWEWLAGQPAVETTRFFRHVRLSSPIVVKVDGRSTRGVILKPPETAA
jgi:hypothetical protein